LIDSVPTGAKLYVNGEPVGTTPYSYSDTRIVGSTNYVRIEKEGFQTLNSSFSRDEELDIGALIGGIFVTIPFLWIMKYKPTHLYELKPLEDQKQIIENPDLKNTESKAERLRELKKLLDDKIITEEEFAREKKKILGQP